MGHGAPPWWSFPVIAAVALGMAVVVPAVAVVLHGRAGVDAVRRELRAWRRA